MRKEIIMAGFGGQGIMTMGTLLATAGMREGKHVTWLPSYGAEQRGGTANCTVVISEEMIGSPIIDRPGYVVVMNPPSLEKFEPKLAEDGYLIINTSLVSSLPGRKDIKTIGVPANRIAEELGNGRVANIVMLGALVSRTGLVDLSTLEALVREIGVKRGAGMADLNLAALEAGRLFETK